MTCGSAFEGSFLNNITALAKRQAATPLLDCERACNADDSCVALNYDGLQCAYLSTVTGIEAKNGSVALWKGKLVISQACSS